jgi:hypothetical protein
LNPVAPDPSGRTDRPALSDPGTAWRIALLASIAVGLCARLFDLGRDGLWTDEGWSLWFATHAGLDDLLRENHPPLYYLMLRGVLTFASSDAGLRAFGTVASVGTAWFAWLLARGLGGSIAAASATAGLVLVAGVDVTVARELRMYPWMACAFAASLAFGLRTASGGGWRDRAALVAAFAALLYLHGIGPYFVLAAVAFALLLVRSRADALRVIACAAVAGALFAPWFVASTLQRLDLMGGGLAWRPPPGVGELLQTWPRLLVDTVPPLPGRDGLQHACDLALSGTLCRALGLGGNVATGKLPLLAAIALVAALAVAGLRGDPRRSWRTLGALAAAAVIPFLLLAASARLLAPFWDPRYLGGCVVPVAALLALWADTSARRAARAVLASLLGFAAVALLALPQQGSLEEWREAMHYLSNERGAGEVVVLNALGQGTPMLFERYATTPELRRDYVSLRDYVDDHYGPARCGSSSDGTCLDRLVLPADAPQTAWMVRWGGLDTPRYPFAPALRAWLDAHFETGSVRRFQGVEVIRMKLRRP